MPIIIALLLLYFGLVTWQMRRAVRATEPVTRLREAKRLLLLVSAGVPLLAALILVAL
jgi:cytochrome oxidase assembly protein ShyY1